MNTEDIMGEIKELLNKRPKRSPWVKYRRTFSKVQLYDVRNRQFYELNITAGFIWDLCDGTHTISDIIRETSEKFSLNNKDINSVIKEIIDFIRECSKKGLIILD